MSDNNENMPTKAEVTQLRQEIGKILEETKTTLRELELIVGGKEGSPLDIARRKVRAEVRQLKNMHRDLKKTEDTFEWGNGQEGD